MLYQNHQDMVKNTKCRFYSNHIESIQYASLLSPKITANEGWFLIGVILKCKCKIPCQKNPTVFR